MGARYYAPWLARWTATDPAGMVDGVNLYAYVCGNPVRLVDPDGRESGEGSEEIPLLTEVEPGQPLSDFPAEIRSPRATYVGILELRNRVWSDSISSVQDRLWNLRVSDDVKLFSPMGENSGVGYRTGQLFPFSRDEALEALAEASGQTVEEVLDDLTHTRRSPAINSVLDIYYEAGYQGFDAAFRYHFHGWQAGPGSEVPSRQDFVSNALSSYLARTQHTRVPAFEISVAVTDIGKFAIFASEESQSVASHWRDPRRSFDEDMTLIWEKYGAVSWESVTLEHHLNTAAELGTYTQQAVYFSPVGSRVWKRIDTDVSHDELQERLDQRRQ